MDATLSYRDSVFSNLDRLFQRGEEIATGLADNRTVDRVERLAGRCGAYHAVLDGIRHEVAKLRVADDEPEESCCPSCSGTGCSRSSRRPDDGGSAVCRSCNGSGRAI